MTDCNLEPARFPSSKGRLVEASFTGGAISSDGGAVLLRQADRMLGLADRAAQALTDPRHKASCRHSLKTILRQRVYALALGYEDLNDHEEMRSDPALAKKAKLVMELSAMAHEASGKKARVFDGFQYAAASWSRSRRVIVKAEHSSRGANPRCIVTSLKGAPQRLYDRMYCVRGDMENRIKKQQLDLFADRTSCRQWWPNQYRLLLSALAYALVEAIRRIALAGGELANAYVGTIRLKLLKIGAVVLRNTRRIRLLLSGSHPRQELFRAAAAKLRPE